MVVSVDTQEVPALWSLVSPVLKTAINEYFVAPPVGMSFVATTIEAELITPGPTKAFAAGLAVL
jgi:hypothetical protein